MRILVPALALAVLVAACGSSPKKAAPTATPSPSGAASSTSAPRTPTPVAAQRNPSPAPRTPTPVAAGGTRAAASATRVTRDDALAQSLLLTTAQLPPPANWSEAPRDTSASPLDRCDPGTFPGETGKADSGDFSRAGEDASLNEGIAIFDSPASVAAAMDSYPAVINCVTQTINAGLLNDATSVYSAATA
ncbi:MAG TPA: hypothetical protein VFA70_01350, partial [Dehalococcoidia bacterium]|nr:hypothetical protein [Dehalococcoidia bacterium]